MGLGEANFVFWCDFANYLDELNLALMVGKSFELHARAVATQFWAVTLNPDPEFEAQNTR